MEDSPGAGLFDKQKDVSLPLKDVVVKAFVKGCLVSTEAELVYKNESSSPMEVVFRFPLDVDMAVKGLSATISGKTVTAKIQEKQKAKAVYDDAISSGLTAALGEERKGDIFSLSLGNLPAEEDAIISLSLVGELPIQMDPPSLVFTLPTVLKPRYTPEGSEPSLAPIGGGEGVHVCKARVGFKTFQLNILNASNVDFVTSPTHEISTSVDERNVYAVQLTDSGKTINEDLVFYIGYKQPHAPRVTVEEGLPVPNDFLSTPIVMLDFFPKFTNIQAACEFVFLVDRSGSMDGSYIKSAAETLVLFLRSIPPGCFFNIIGFGSSFTSLFPKSIQYNQSNLNAAVKHAESLHADLGGTELLPPLKHIFNLELLSGLSRQVFVLTDGSVDNTSACINLARKNQSVARVFTFGIGSGASTALVKGLASAGNGSAEFVHSGERMQPKVIRSLKKALQPSMTNLEVKFDVPVGTVVQQAPSRVPPVFNGERVVMYGLLTNERSPVHGKCSATLTGDILGENIEHKLDFGIPTGSNTTDVVLFENIVHCLAAKRLIQDWQDGNGPLEWNPEERKAAILKLSLDSGVVSSHTALVAVNENQQQVVEGALQVWDLTAADYSSSDSSCSDIDECGVMYAGEEMLEEFEIPMFCSSISTDDIKLDCGGEKEMVLDEDSLVHNHCAPYSDEGESLHAGQSNHKKVSNSSGKYSLLATLLSLQAAEGFWTLSEELAGIVEQPLEKLVGGCLTDCSSEIWATALALACLERRFPAEKEEWELVAMKSETWLMSAMGGNVSQVKEAALNFF